MLALSMFGFYHYNDGLSTISYLGDSGTLYTIMHDGTVYHMRIKSIHGGEAENHEYNDLSAAIAAIETAESKN